MRLPHGPAPALPASRSSAIGSRGPGSPAAGSPGFGSPAAVSRGPGSPAAVSRGPGSPDACSRGPGLPAPGSRAPFAFASSGFVALALAAFVLAALPEAAEAQRRGTRGAASGRSVRSTSPHAVTTRALRATRGRSLSVRSVPTTPFGIRRLPVIGRDGRVSPDDAFLRPFIPRGAPIVEVIPRDPFGRDGFDRDRRDRDRFDRDRRDRDRFDRDRRDRDRFDRDRRDRFDRDRRDPFGRDGFRRDRRFPVHGDACASGGGLRVRVGSHGVSVGVGSRGHGAGRSAGFRCVKDRHGAIILVPVGGLYYGGTAANGAYATPDEAPVGDGYYAENAAGAEFSGNDRGIPMATGCAAVTVRLRGGEWYGGHVRLPALDAETPEALAAALHARHRHGRSTMLAGFDGLKVAVPAGPGVEAVEVEPCF